MIEDVFDSSEAFECRRAERDQVRHDNMIHVQGSIAVGRLLVELAQHCIDGVDQPMPHDLPVVTWDGLRRPGVDFG
jgi:hypothetical protein